VELTNVIPELKGNEKDIIKKIYFLYQDNKKEEAFKLLNKIEENAQTEENNLALYHINTLKCFIFNNEKQFEQSVHHGKIAIEIASKYYDTINLSHTYLNICASYYQSEQHDSAEKFTKLGFEHALIIGDSMMIKTFTMNLGTISFNHNLTGLAGYYFMKASSINISGFANTDTLLYANLISILISNKNYQEAEKLWNMYQLDGALEGSTYLNQDLQCNRIALLQGQKNWDKSRELLSTLDLNTFNPDFKSGLFTNKWNQIYHDNGIEACSDYFTKNKKFIADHFPEVVTSLITLLPHDQIHHIGIFNADYIQSLINEFKINESEDLLLIYSAHLLLGILLHHEN
jgi:tetratricopeptide (TPR) repeat protein